MKSRRKSFRGKLWRYFALFAIAILAILWVLQTVFLQVFYEGAVKGSVKQAAAQIEQSWMSDDQAAFTEYIDAIASDKSLLVIVADWDGQVLYSTDEHSAAYRIRQGNEDGQSGDNQTTDSSNSAMHGGYGASDASSGSGSGWKRGQGQGRNLGLAQGFNVFRDLLASEPGVPVEYQDDDGSLYAYCEVLPSGGSAGSVGEQAGSEAILYLSTTLQPVGATVSAIRVQLLVASAVALLLAFALAFALSLGFSKPVEELTAKARRLAKTPAADVDDADDSIADGSGFQEGFCSELDDLSLAMDEAGEELALVEARRREFLANISHDLRTPLTLIRGYAEAARDEAREDDDTLKDDLGIIVHESERLGQLVNEILDYSALQGRAVSLDERVFDASEVFGAVVSTFVPLCERDGLKLETALEDGLVVRGDESRLARVVYNLVDNAISHSPEGATVRMSLAAQDDAVRFEVNDQGEGIPADELDHVWERYFTKKQAKRNSQGSGLGLAISKEILEAHHARYGVISEPGEGSTFWFELDRWEDDSL